MNEATPKAFERPLLRRPHPERTQPKRGVLGVFGQSDWQDHSRTTASHPLGFDIGGPDEQPGFDFSDSDIRAASDLIDRHIAHGKDFQPDFDAGILAQLSRLYNQGLPPDVAEMITTAARNYAGLMTTWVDLAGSLRELLQTRTEPASPNAPVSAAVPNPPIVVQSSRPVELRVEMFRPYGTLRVQPLQSENPAQIGRIDSITLDAGTLRVVVPPDQPSGHYHGLLLDETAGPVGAVTLRILAVRDGAT